MEQKEEPIYENVPRKPRKNINLQNFEKRAGTTDRGTDYEHLYMAHLILKLTLDEQIENFYLSSNDKKFGSFDDVVLMTEYYHKEETEVYAIQLKQSKNKVLRSNDLTATKGSFSIVQYLQDYCENLTNLEVPVKMILYTNRKAQIPTEIELEFKEEKFNVEITNVDSDDLLESSKQGLCYKFAAENKYENFFRNFFVYTNQADVYQIEEKSLKLFQDNFGRDESVFKECVNFITKWSLKEGNKEKLDKVWMQQMIAMCVLSPFIKTLTFNEEDFSENAKTFRSTVSKFQVTILQKDNFDKIRNLWGDLGIEDFDQVDKTRRKFHIRLEKITTVEELKKEAKEASKLLWLLGKCPLVVKNCPQVPKIVKFCQNSLIVLTSTEDSAFTTKSFQSLSDLKSERELYEQILKNFTYSIEDQKETPLKNLVVLDVNFRKIITTDKLVHMLDKPLRIGHQKEVLLPYHMTRTLSKVFIHPQFLEELESTLIMISEVKDLTTFQETLKDVEVIEVTRGVELESCGTKEKVIFVTRDEFSEEDFDDLCVENFEKLMKKSHQLRYLNGQCLEWVRSRNGVEDLLWFQLNQEYTIHESSLLGDLENSVNIVCGNSGMGKSTLMKSLKTYSCSSVWTILILVRNHALQLRLKEADKFLEYLLNEKCKECGDLDQKVFKICMQTSHVRLIWDGLDEVSDETLEKILNMITAISKKGIKQWVTSRNNLKRVLESRFKTFSRAIQPFNMKEQRDFIGKRLHVSEDEVFDVFTKIKRNIHVFSNSDILGIPLQIDMLTELFCRNKQKYSDLFEEIFTILDLYENFVEDKFLIYYTEKIKSDLSIEQNYQKFIQEMKTRIDCYKKVAFNLYIRNSSNTDTFLEEISRVGDSLGFISTVSENTPEFCHNSFGEYFAALYLFDNDPRKSKEKKFTSDQKFNNIRFFLDLKLSQTSKVHIAILCKNSVLLDKCDERDINYKDKIGRSTLEVACAWSRHYKVLDFKENTHGQFNFQDKYMNDESLEKLSYKDISKSFNQIDKVDIRIKRLMLLLPSFIPLYNKSLHRFDEKSAASILYYSIKFDYVVIFKYINSIPWLEEAYGNFETKCLLSFAMTCKSRQVLEEIVSNKQNRELLRQNLNLILATCEVDFDEVVTLLVKNSVNINELLFLACWEGKVENVQFLLDKGVKLDVRGAYDRMPLHYACDNERYGLEIVKLLVEAGAEVNVPDIDDQMPLHYACGNAMGFDIVNFLRDKGADVNASDVYSLTPLHYACDNEEDGFRIVKLLVVEGANLDIKDVHGLTPLHYACMNWKYGFSIVKLLMEESVEADVVDVYGRMPLHYACKNYLHGFGIVNLMVAVNVNVQDNDGCTPTHYACEKGKTETVTTLIRSDANISVANLLGQTPLHYACKNYPHGYDMVKLLTDFDVSVNSTDVYRRSPLHYACENGKLKTVQLLLDKGAEDFPDTSQRLPIHFACENKDHGYEIVKLLINKGAKVDACDETGKVAMHFACRTGNVYVVQVLIDEKGKVDLPDNKGRLPIHYACMNWNFGFEIVRLLRNEGTELNVRDEKGRMPVHYACKTGNLRTVTLLVDMGALVDVKDNDGLAPSDFALRARNFNVVRFLIKEKLCDRV